MTGFANVVLGRRLDAERCCLVRGSPRSGRLGSADQLVAGQLLLSVIAEAVTAPCPPVMGLPPSALVFDVRMRAGDGQWGALLANMVEMGQIEYGLAFGENADP